MYSSNTFSAKRNNNNNNNKHSVDSVQKTAVFETSHTLLNVLQFENLKPEGWESPLVQEKYQEEKDCHKRHNNNNRHS